MVRHSTRLSLGCLGLALTLVPAACSESPAPASPSQTPAPQGLDRTAVIAALDYWQSAAGITYVIVAAPDEPRMLIRPGTDGLAPQGGGRAVLDGTYPEDNRARSGLVVFEPGGGQWCQTMGLSCRYLYRHEIGHNMGFLDHSESGLMRSGTDTLTDRELRMIRSLYSLPHGARVESSGQWSVAGTTQAGQLADTQAAQDIISWNMNATGSRSYRQAGVITRWELPVRVYLQDR